MDPRLTPGQTAIDKAKADIEKRKAALARLGIDTGLPPGLGNILDRGSNIPDTPTSRAGGVGGLDITSPTPAAEEKLDPASPRTFEDAYKGVDAWLTARRLPTIHGTIGELEALKPGGGNKAFEPHVSKQLSFQEEKELEQRNQVQLRALRLLVKRDANDEPNVNIAQTEDGQSAINVTDAVNKLTQAYFTKMAIARYGDVSAIPSGKAEEIWTQANQDAKRKVNLVSTLGSGIPLVVDDEQTIVNKIAGAPALLRPLLAAATPRSTATFTPHGEAQVAGEHPAEALMRMLTVPTATFNATIQERDAERKQSGHILPLDSKLRGGMAGPLPLSIDVGGAAVANTIELARAFGTSDPEASRRLVATIRANPMGAQLMRQQAKDLLTAYDVDTTKPTGATLVDMATIGGLFSLDFGIPDAASPAIGLTTLAGKGARAWAEGLRWSHVTRILEEASVAAKARQAVDIGKVAARLDATDAGVGMLFRLRLASEYGVTDSKAAIQSGLEATGPALEKAEAKVAATQAKQDADYTKAFSQVDTDQARFAGLVDRFTKEVTGDLAMTTAAEPALLRTAAELEEYRPGGALHIPEAKATWRQYKALDKELGKVTEGLRADLRAAARAYPNIQGTPLHARILERQERIGQLLTSRAQLQDKLATYFAPTYPELVASTSPRAPAPGGVEGALQESGQVLEGLVPPLGHADAEEAVKVAEAARAKADFKLAGVETAKVYAAKRAKTVNTVFLVKEIKALTKYDKELGARWDAMNTAIRTKDVAAADAATARVVARADEISKSLVKQESQLRAAAAARATEVENAQRALNELRAGKKGTAEPTAPAAPDRDTAFNALADAQRGEPEHAMLRIKRAGGMDLSAVYSITTEDVGDIINRLGDQTAKLGGGYYTIPKKIRTGLRGVAGYPMEKEIAGGIRQAIAEGRTTLNPEEAEKALRAAGQEYADAHKALPTYNELQRTAQEAAVALGEWRWSDAASALRKLEGYANEGEDAWKARALEYEPPAPATPAAPPALSPQEQQALNQLATLLSTEDSAQITQAIELADSMGLLEPLARELTEPKALLRRINHNGEDYKSYPFLKALRQVLAKLAETSPKEADVLIARVIEVAERTPEYTPIRNLFVATPRTPEAFQTFLSDLTKKHNGSITPYKGEWDTFLQERAAKYAPEGARSELVIPHNNAYVLEGPHVDDMGDAGASAGFTDHVFAVDLPETAGGAQRTLVAIKGPESGFIDWFDHTARTGAKPTGPALPTPTPTTNPWQTFLDDLQSGEAFNKARAYRLAKQKMFYKLMSKDELATLKINRNIEKVKAAQAELAKYKDNLPNYSDLQDRYRQTLDQLERSQRRVNKANRSLVVAQTRSTAHQRVLDEMLEQAKTAKDTGSGHFIELSKNARRDPSIRYEDPRNPGLFTLGQKFQISPIRLTNWLDKTGAIATAKTSNLAMKYGEIAPRLQASIQRAEATADLFNDEFHTLSASSAFSSEEQRMELATRLLTTNDPIKLMRGSPRVSLSNSAARGDTPWEAMVALINGAEKDSPASAVLRGFATAFVPSGVTTSEDTVGILMGYTRSLLGKIDKADPATFKFVTEELRSRTAALFDGATDSGAKANAFLLANVAKGATLKWLADDVAHAGLGRIPDSLAQDINKLFGAEGGVAKASNVALAVEHMTNMGLPITRQGLRREGNVGQVKNLYRMVKLGQDGGSDSIYMMDHLVQSVDQKFGDIIKDVTRKHEGGYVEETARNAVRKANQIWRASVVQGWIWPDPTYAVNNLFGDTAQIFTERGAVAAASNAARALTSLPLSISDSIGGGLARWIEHLKTGPNAGKYLGSVIESIFDPDINRVLARRPGEWTVMKNGTRMTTDRLGLWAAEDGILDSQISQEFHQAIEREMPGRVKSLYRGYQKGIQKIAQSVSTRQRLSLYLHIIKSGGTREEAARAVSRALYDWNNGITSWEAKYVAKLVPFWRYKRLAATQMLKAFTDPFVDTTSAAHALESSRVQNLKRQLIIKERLLGNPDTDDEDTAYNRELEDLGRLFRPDFAPDRPLYDIDYLPLAEQRRQLAMSGRLVTHSQTQLPPLTTFDQVDMMMSLFNATVGMGMAMGSDNVELGEDYYTETFFKPFLQVLGPGTREAAGSLIDALGGESGQYLTGKLSAAETMEMVAWNNTMPPLPYMNHMGVPIAYDGTRAYVGKASALLLRNMPGIMQVSPFLKAAYINNPGKTKAEFFSTFIKQFSGLTNTNNYNPSTSMTMRQERIQTELNELVGGELDNPHAPALRSTAE